MVKKKSDGGLYIGVGLGLIFIAGFVAAKSGALWSVILWGLVFSVIGLIKAKGGLRRIFGVIVFTLSGGLFVRGFLAFFVGQEASDKKKSAQVTIVPNP